MIISKYENKSFEEFPFKMQDELHMTDKWRNSRYENNMSTKEGDIIIQRAKLLFNLSEEEGELNVGSGYISLQ